MQLLLSFGKNAGRGAWLVAALLLALGWLRPQAALASHIRAGDIQAKVDTTAAHNPNRIFYKLTLYRDITGVDQPTVTMYFGDGTRLDGIPKASTVRVGQTDIFSYYCEHTYPAAGPYPVSFVGENRNTGVLNMAASNTQTFYVSTTITINPAYGLNHSPVLRAPAVDQGTVGQVFLHNPAGYDADGDSLVYHLRTCQQVVNGTTAANVTNLPTPTVCTNYVYPDDASITPGTTPMQVAYNGVPAGNPSQRAFISQDINTGQITWNAPARAGIYNIAFTVDEIRRTANGFRVIGQVIRDMQIIIQATNNLPPVLTVPPDLCVVADTPVTLTVSATDGSSATVPATNVTLSAFSGILPPATFRQNNTGTSVTGTFQWTPGNSAVAGSTTAPGGSNVSDQPYIVVFRAQDTPPNAASQPLVDIRPVRITVVGPPPQNLRATPSGTPGGLVSVLTWNLYKYQNASQILIYRKENPSNFNPGPCDTGIPASAGYTQVGAVPVSATSFSDNTGLVRGKTYCYRIYATFPLPAGGASIASAEACLTFNGRSAMLTNVDVNTTNTATGQITVKWTQPKADVGTFTSPIYRLTRQIGTGAPTLAATITNLADTTYVDNGLNTVANQYTYTLTFLSGTGATQVQETAPSATSVRTSLVPNGITKAITVNWAYNVPWDNSKQPSRIYRRDPGSTTFNQIATVTPGATSGTYVDQNLVAGQEYCYYVQTTGQYANYSFLSNLLNKSQQICATLQAVPCTPVLTLQVVNCDSLASLASYLPVNQTYQNNLRWTVGSTPAGCEANAVYYRIFRSDTDGGPYVLIDSTTQRTYSDRNRPRPTYCYKVQAVAASGQRSGLSNSACQADCVFFILPNIFIPGSNSTANQVFRPKTTSPLLRTHIQIFNRWGRKVYESDRDPYINWTGGGVAGESGTSGMVSGGIYYYLAEVEFADAAQTKRTYKGWVELVR
ncbi:T9SS type B sorting domain-containing protein [Hymenobacter cheonanensis]|uniref:T9SS type B sorting domain-containing protein n=1 Tax=Hymenobacter sp. CA2-7 TaxID=3063993 RepID=UPI002712E7DD|nr:gliding motility-associated C-terminal domain-containing protein [Hymenobacter sp. CA2-7]MDO7887492.1 gliding motility-associated C-terminal domain-containing protein [Hymenobacter sp. CA2-7]